MRDDSLDTLRLLPCARDEAADLQATKQWRGSGARAVAVETIETPKTVLRRKKRSETLRRPSRVNKQRLTTKQEQQHASRQAGSRDEEALPPASRSSEQADTDATGPRDTTPLRKRTTSPRRSVRWSCVVVTVGDVQRDAITGAESRACARRALSSCASAYSSHTRLSLCRSHTQQ